MERIELSETSCRQFKAPAMPPLLKDKRVAGPSQATKYQRATPRFFFEGGKKSSSNFYFVIQNKKKMGCSGTRASDYTRFYYSLSDSGRQFNVRGLLLTILCLLLGAV